MKTDQPVTDTRHSRQRQQERGIADCYLDIALKYGTRCWMRGGARACYLRWRDIPDWMPERDARRAHGIVAILAEGKIVTTYRDPKFLQQVKHQPRWGRSH